MTSVIDWCASTPADETIARSVTPLVKNPNCPVVVDASIAARASRAWSSGPIAATASSKPSTSGSGIEPGRPGKPSSATALSAASAARCASSLSPSSSSRFVEEVPILPSRITRSVTTQFSISVG